MDALDFLKEHKRMCNSYEHCKGCPLERDFCSFGSNTPDEAYERIIATVEQWAIEHPRKTRQSVFLEQYPEAILDVFGVMQMCPMEISAAHRDSDGECNDPEKLCIDCRREFWMQEVE